MIQRMSRAAAGLIAMIAGTLCLVSSPALAQSPREARRWSGLGALHAGREVRVEVTGGNRLAGAIQAVDENRLTLRERSGSTANVERNSVRRVTVKSRGRAALYGLLIGFGAGFVAGATAGPYIVDFGNPGGARRVKYGAGWGAFVGGIGAGVGALTGARIALYP
jgi:hypothetical protein